MKFASIVLIFCLTTPLLAQTVDPPALPLIEAKIVLVCPDSVRVGELVRLDVSESSATSFKWILVPDSVDFQVYAEGRKAVFSARVEGDYRFIVACAIGDSVDVVTHVVHVIGPPATPLSNSLSEWIPYWLWNYDLPSDQREALANSFESIAAQEGTLKTPADWIKATSESNRVALGDSIDQWAPILDKIGTSLLKMAQEGTLTTPAQHAQIWREIATGLRK